jgi:hypothetical protein
MQYNLSMSFICKICEKYPNSHSLTKYEETNDYIVYYTCPSNAKNNEINGILTHFDGTLEETKDKNWIWILDLKGFNMKNFLEIGNTISIIKLINEKYSVSLQKIIVINTNSYAGTMYNLVKPVLNERMRSLIFFPDNTSKSS